MKKIILVSLLSLLFVPLITKASLDTNLYYGLRNNSDVKQLQEVLIDKGFLTGSATGNFYSLTLKAVKVYQIGAGISSTGYVGNLTRKAINDELVANLSASNQEATNETGSTPPALTPQATTNDVVKSLQNQIAILMQQLTAMQAQQTTAQQLQQTVQQQAQTIQQIQQDTQQIVQNTTLPAQNVNYPKVTRLDVRPSDIGVSFGIEVDRDFIYEITLSNGLTKKSTNYYNTGIGLGFGFSWPFDSSKDLYPDTEYAYIVKITDRNGNVTEKNGTFKTLRWIMGGVKIDSVSNVSFSYGVTDNVTGAEQLIATSNEGDQVSIKLFFSSSSFNNPISGMIIKIDDKEMVTDNSGNLIYNYTAIKGFNDTFLTIRYPDQSDDTTFGRTRKILLKIK